MENLSYRLSCIKKDLYTFLFFFLFLSCSHSSHSLRYLSLGTLLQLTHPPVKSSTLPLRMMPVFQGVAPWHKIFTSSCFISLWDTASAHSPSGKELIPTFLEESCFSGVIVLLMFSYCPAWAVFGLVLTHITR